MYTSKVIDIGVRRPKIRGVSLIFLDPFLKLSPIVIKALQDMRILINGI